MGLTDQNPSKRPRTWWWEIRMTVPVTVSMPRAVYGWIKPWLVRRGVEIKRAGVRSL
jgi:hypothetical protein